MSRDILRYVSFGNLSFAIMSSTLHSCKLKEQLPHIRAPLVERRILTLHTVQLILQCSNINDWSTPYICQEVLLCKKKNYVVSCWKSILVFHLSHSCKMFNMYSIQHCIASCKKKLAPCYNTLIHAIKQHYFQTFLGILEHRNPAGT